MNLSQIFDPIINLLVNFIEQIGYLGIFIGMFLESTMFPMPSELIMIPAGMSAAYGKMNIYLIIFYGTLGNILGAVFSYYLANHLGRPILFKIGKYFFVREKTIIKIEEFFKNHGSISVFIGRLLPGFRHFISLPAGVAKMNIKLFCFYTATGSALWNSILTILGFIIGGNKDLIKEYLHLIILACVIFCVVLVIFYIWLKKSR